MSLHLGMFRKIIGREQDREIKYERDRAGRWTSGMKERGFESEIPHFLECCKSREVPLASDAEPVKTLQLMEDLIRLGEGTS
jgi:hypothetical protein